MKKPLLVSALILGLPSWVLAQEVLPPARRSASALDPAYDVLLPDPDGPTTPVNYQTILNAAPFNYSSNQYGRTSFIFGGVRGMQMPVSFAKNGSPSGLSVYEQVHNASIFSLYLPAANIADVKRAMGSRNYGDTGFWTRVNALNSPWGLEDLLETIPAIGNKLDVVMIPKVEGAWDIDRKSVV